MPDKFVLSLSPWTLKLQYCMKSSSCHSSQFWLLLRHHNGRIGSFGTLYKVPRAKKREHEVYTTLLLSLYILDTVEAGILLAIGSAYLNLH
jgi:hypothetical protein